MPKTPVFSNAINRDDTLADNPLVWPLLSLLQRSQHWKIHYLITELTHQGLLNNLDNDEHKLLFKRNFLTMNALYRLQEMLLPTQWLQVDAMDIYITDLIPDKIELMLKQDTALREYYLAWENYDSTTETITHLLNDFWDKYNGYIDRHAATIDRQKALTILGLTEQATQAQIRKRWRKLALQWHPDRHPGHDEEFRRACRAWHSLRVR